MMREKDKKNIINEQLNIVVRQLFQCFKWESCKPMLLHTAAWAFCCNMPTLHCLLCCIVASVLRFLCYSMTQLLTHIVAHSARPCSRPQTNNQSIKKFLSLEVSWVKAVKNCKILTFLCQKLSESVYFFSLKNIILETHFWLLPYFESINF